MTGPDAAASERDNAPEHVDVPRQIWLQLKYDMNLSSIFQNPDWHQRPIESNATVP